MTKTFLRLPEVERVTGLPVSSIYEEMGRNTSNKSRSAQTALPGSRTKSSNGRRLASLSGTILRSRLRKPSAQRGASVPGSPTNHNRQLLPGKKNCSAPFQRSPSKREVMSEYSPNAPRAQQVSGDLFGFTPPADPSNLVGLHVILWAANRTDCSASTQT